MNKKTLSTFFIFLLVITTAKAQMSKVHILDLSYDNEVITLNDKITKFGYAPDRKIQPDDGYTAEVIAIDNSVLYSFRFKVPLELYLDITDPVTGELTGGMIKLDKTDFALVIPYFEDAKEIRLYNSSKQELLAIDVEEKLSRKNIIWLWLVPPLVLIILIWLVVKARKK
ncbi:hypothetical protein J4209_03720 [Candidatus Woesearchaeota archaeon]|nr:hypothetical protein [Candidatus Woesearchaeota archaeon]